MSGWFSSFLPAGFQASRISDLTSTVDPPSVPRLERNISNSSNSASFAFIDSTSPSVRTLDRDASFTVRSPSMQRQLSATGLQRQASASSSMQRQRSTSSSSYTDTSHQSQPQLRPSFKDALLKSSRASEIMKQAQSESLPPYTPPQPSLSKASSYASVSSDTCATPFSVIDTPRAGSISPFALSRSQSQQSNSSLALDPEIIFIDSVQNAAGSGDSNESILQRFRSPHPPTPDVPCIEEEYEDEQSVDADDSRGYDLDDFNVRHNHLPQKAHSVASHLHKSSKPRFKPTHRDDWYTEWISRKEPVNFFKTKNHSLDRLENAVKRKPFHQTGHEQSSGKVPIPPMRHLYLDDGFPRTGEDWQKYFMRQFNPSEGYEDGGTRGKMYKRAMRETGKPPDGMKVPDWSGDWPNSKKERERLEQISTVELESSVPTKHAILLADRAERVAKANRDAEHRRSLPPKTQSSSKADPFVRRRSTKNHWMAAEDTRFNGSNKYDRGVTDEFGRRPGDYSIAYSTTFDEFKYRFYVAFHERIISCLDDSVQFAMCALEHAPTATSAQKRFMELMHKEHILDSQIHLVYHAPTENNGRWMDSTGSVHEPDDPDNRHFHCLPDSVPSILCSTSTRYSLHSGLDDLSLLICAAIPHTDVTDQEFLSGHARRIPAHNRLSQVQANRLIPLFIVRAIPRNRDGHFPRVCHTWPQQRDVLSLSRGRPKGEEVGPAIEPNFLRRMVDEEHTKRRRAGRYQKEVEIAEDQATLEED